MLKIYCLHSFYSGYKCLETNELCRDYGLTQVCYPTECGGKAATYCGLNNATINQITQSDVPNGCFIRAGDAYYNWHGDIRHPTAAPICWT